MIAVTAEREAQLQFIGLKQEDLNLLQGSRAVFERIVDRLVDSLYGQIAAKPELKTIIEAHSTLERLKATQRTYFLSMTDGTIDEAYFNNRLLVGKIHSRIGLTTQWYLGAYMIYLDLAAAHLAAELPGQWTPVLHSLTKMFNLDSQLVLEAYEKDEKAKLERVLDSQSHILTGVSEAIRQLAAGMEQVSRSTAAVNRLARATVLSQEQTDAELGLLGEQIGSIESMGALMGDISDRTHLLGLNAAIEAARAGEQGRGFEVVAGEVRKLARHSKESLELIQEKVESIGEVLHKVQAMSRDTAQAAGEQAASSEELALFIRIIEKVSVELEQLKSQAERSIADGVASDG
ncbi:MULTISPECIES: globin-coupled sensor protein [unclassified Paenibacillus]|uniref:globin-coupled sensor protein n=1 Tax=unclassified Paenibacillus TaxID=185978 RepID=UPI000956DAA5|nr:MULTISPECIES: globin-coupled sensor protein [unclassified Paenibacillus]ASS65548.1 chemotaxis protein [Paenibacillus sp. RUD330]SIQ32417.1 heam-based aerotactic trancducer [Paenibacillus sp. RU4X]SIQ53991.1 heam-based aerotactic trancducer [Paenibacillus sp. RU4T]